jgi:hypothetical protein
MNKVKQGGAVEARSTGERISADELAQLARPSRPSVGKSSLRSAWRASTEARSAGGITSPPSTRSAQRRGNIL